jgi:hypothetical protein
MSEQTKAERLADALDRWHDGRIVDEAAAELRRLSAVEQQEPVADRAVFERWYAETWGDGSNWVGAESELVWLAYLEATRAALKQPEQEPVAWRYKGMMGMPWSLSDYGYYVSCKRDNGYMVEPLYTHPPRREPEQAEREPVAWMTHTNDLLPLFHKNRKAALNWQTQPTPLYTAPPRREWQSLSEEDMDCWTPEIHPVIRAVEAKLKEKNHG